MIPERATPELAETLDQRVDLKRRADGEHAARVLPGLALDLDKPFVRERVLVQHRHLVTLREGTLGNGGPNASRSYDQHEHRAGCY